MRKIAKYAPTKPFRAMSTNEKLGFYAKLLIFVSTMGFMFPRLLSDWAEEQPSRKGEMPKITPAPTH